MKYKKTMEHKHILEWSLYIQSSFTIVIFVIAFMLFMHGQDRIRLMIQRVIPLKIAIQINLIVYAMAFFYLLTPWVAWRIWQEKIWYMLSLTSEETPTMFGHLHDTFGWMSILTVLTWALILDLTRAKKSA